MQELVSVIMSTHKTKEEYLRDSINSILNQTYTNFELIVVCDGAEEDEKILSNINDKRIKIIKNDTKKGLAISLNKAIDISNGKYILRMDSDDIAQRNRIEKQVEYMDKNINVDIASCFYKTFGIENKTIVTPFIHSDEIKAMLLIKPILLHPGIIMRKTFIDKHNMRYDEKFLYAQDFELWARYKNKCTMAIIPQKLMNYRRHENQVGQNKPKEQNEFAKKVLERNLRELKIDEENYIYLEILSGRKKCDSLEEVQKFCKLVYEKNNIYDSKTLEMILSYKMFELSIKNKNLKYILKNLNIRNISNLLKKIKLKFYF